MIISQESKNGKSWSFQNFFFNFEIGHKKMSKMDFKKKVCKNENHFFFNFFLKRFFLNFYTLNDLSTFDKNEDETIRKKVKKWDFFRIFRDFSNFFGTDWTTFGQLWTTFG